ncbi:MAG: hypothetical protein MJK12_00710 [Colwellia sp.]|nr:hypothetical protein [Colwellia sp.]
MAKNVYVQDERYVVVPWMAKNVYVLAFLRHPVFQGISASMHVDERYIVVPWMAKSVYVPYGRFLVLGKTYVLISLLAQFLALKSV